MNKKIKPLLLAAGVLLTACSTPNKLGFLRDLEYNIPFEAAPAPELTLKVDDRITIQVFSDEPALAAPFNAISVTEAETADLLTITYGVDVRGDIDFPVLGSLHVEGLTLKQVQDEIARQIRERGYIKDPVVKAELVNFTITVIGEMGSLLLPVESNSINIFQVLAQVESINTEKSKIPDVMVVRTENGKREAFSVNLQSKDIYSSPVFYLQQNDMVYVQPRGLRLSSGGDAFVQIFAPVVSAIASVAYILIWTAR
ncbi:polysaccharide export outer membrane protein [Bacteroidales bacterium WCE2004]|jgi:polysaccharide export outer membrane protein|nr:polysaccharide biosynthesis/export family protein [Bacteroidales bacterium]SKC38901.1 polysaccharide export outer membrane protein [Bacteroidales bacterium WCE2004]